MSHGFVDLGYPFSKMRESKVRWFFFFFNTWKIPVLYAKRFFFLLQNSSFLYQCETHFVKDNKASWQPPPPELPWVM